MDVGRGDVVIVELDPTACSEQRGTRPVWSCKTTSGTRTP